MRLLLRVLPTEEEIHYVSKSQPNYRTNDPELGRFIEPEAEIPGLFSPQSYNRYSYCVNDPLRYNDPTGHAPLLFDSEAWGQLLSPVKNFFVGGQYPANNERAMLAQEGIQQWTPLTDAHGNKLGNPATAVVKAGGGALLQAAMMVGPMGEEKAAVTTLKEGKKAVEEVVEETIRIRHYINNKGLEGIAESGIIRASNQDSPTSMLSASFCSGSCQRIHQPFAPSPSPFQSVHRIGGLGRHFGGGVWLLTPTIHPGRENGLFKSCQRQ